MYLRKLRLFFLINVDETAARPLVYEDCSSMLLYLTLIALGCVFLYFGGEQLLRGAIDLGRSLGWTQSIVGLVLVSLGTSAPELFVSGGAAIQGFGNIAVGNVVGSNIVNIAVVLGVGAVTLPLIVDQSLRTRQIPVMVVLTAASVLLLLDGVLTRIEATLLLTGAIGSIAWALCHHDTTGETDYGSGRTPVSVSSGLRLLAGVGLLVVGAEALIWGGVELAKVMGISQAIIGLTVTALGTSLPEIAATLVAVVKRQVDVAVGNVVGSNVMNLGLVLGFSGFLVPLYSDDIGVAPLVVMLGLTVSMGIVAWRASRFSRWTGSGLLLSYLGYVYVVLP